MQEEAIAKQRRVAKTTMLRLDYDVDPDVRKRTLLDHRLKSPERWAEEEKDVDSLTSTKKSLHKAKWGGSKSSVRSPKVALPPDECIREGLRLKGDGNIVEARMMLQSAADAGVPQAQHELALLFIDAALDEDRDASGRVGSGPNSLTYYKKARKLLKQAADAVSAALSMSLVNTFPLSVLFTSHWQPRLYPISCHVASRA